MIFFSWNYSLDSLLKLAYFKQFREFLNSLFSKYKNAFLRIIDQNWDFQVVI